jgi:CelD/BcsL family acetyltransferase involved in cellulose biosynthesis
MSERHGTGGLRLELHDSPEAVAHGWDRLADRLAAPPFVRPGWIVAWARAFAPGRLRVLAAVREAELMGVLPFIERFGVVGAPANWHTPVFSFLAVDREVSDALAREFVARGRLRADVSFLDVSDPNLGAYRTAAERLGLSVAIRTIARSPYVQLGGSDWEAYRRSLARKLRKELDRLRRRLDEQGTVSVDVANGDADFARSLEQGFGLETSGWKRERGTAIVSEPKIHRFYTEVAEWARTRGWLAMAFLRLDGRPIAFDFCLQSGGVVYALKGGFDPTFRRFGPGMLLTHESLRLAFERGVDSYEFLGDDARYKLAWTPTVRELVRFQAFGRSLPARINQLAWSHGRDAVKYALQAGRQARRA